MIGVSEATAIEAIGKAEAERMRQKAAAYKQYGDAALMSLILDSLPKVSDIHILPQSHFFHHGCTTATYSGVQNQAFSQRASGRP